MLCLPLLSPIANYAPALQSLLPRLLVKLVRNRYPAFPHAYTICESAAHHGASP